MRPRVAADVRIDDDVVALTQVALRDELVGEVVVGHAVVVEGATHPALVLRATPGVQERDAWKVQFVRRDIRHVVRTVALQAELREARLEHRAVRVRDDERARAEGAAVHLELLFGREHAHVAVLIAECHEVVVGRVVHHHRAAPARDSARGTRGYREQCHVLFEHPRVFDLDDLDIAHELEGPARVIVRTGVVERELLQGEVHVGQRTEWLVRPDQVVTGLDLDTASLEGAVCTVNLEALPHELVDGVHRVGAPALARRDEPGIDGALDALPYRSLVLHPVVVEERLSVIRGVLEREQHR